MSGCCRHRSMPDFRKFWFMPRLEAKSNCSFSAIRHSGTESRFFFPKVCGKEMEFYRIEDPGQLKRECFLSRNRMSNNIRFLLCREWGGMDSCPRCCIRRKGDAARIRRRVLRSLPEAERKSAQDRNCVWRTDRQKNSNGNT